MEKLPFEKAALEAIPPDKKDTRPLVPAGSSRKSESPHGHIDENLGPGLSDGDASKEKTAFLRRPLDSGETIQDKGSQTEFVAIAKEGETGEKEDKKDGVNEGVELISGVDPPFRGDGELRSRQREEQKPEGNEREGQRGEMSAGTFIMDGEHSSFSPDNGDSEEEEDAETFHHSVMEKNLGEASTSFAWMFEYRCTRYILEDDRENSRALG